MQFWNRNSGLSEPSFTTGYHHHQSPTPTAAQKASIVQSWRVIAPPKSSERSHKTSSSTTTNSPPSVKHLTCYFWAKNGTCKWNDDECLYAHHDTGKVANGPLQVEPGRKSDTLHFIDTSSQEVRSSCRRQKCNNCSSRLRRLACQPSQPAHDRTSSSNAAAYPRPACIHRSQSRARP